MKVSLVRARYPSVWEPTNLMYVSAFIKDRYKGDLKVQILDGYFDSDEQILKDVADSDIVGFSGTTPQVPHILTLARKVKTQNKNIKTVAGGYGPSLQPFKFLNESAIDHLVVGEGEQSMLDILEKRASSKLVSNPPIMDVDSIPNPDRDSINLERYISIAEREEGRRVTSIMTERGCAFGCTFCLLPDTKIKMADTTEKEIKDVKLGDLLWTYDEHTLKKKVGKVTNVFTHDTSEYYKITYGTKRWGGIKTICITGNHPIYTQRGWVNAEDLTLDDKVLRVYHTSMDGRGFPQSTYVNRAKAFSEGKISLDWLRTDEVYAKLSARLKENNPMKRREVANKVAMKMKGRKAPHNAGPHPWVSKRMLENNPMRDPKIKQRQLETQRANYIKNGFSRGQQKLYDYLDELKIPYVPELIVGDRLLDAAVIPLQLDFEYDGWYLHKKYPARDKARDEYLARRGWKTVRFTEKEIDSKETTLCKINDAINHRMKNSKNFTPIIKIEKVCQPSPVYNLEVESAHTYVANGILVHNCAEGDFGTIWRKADLKNEKMNYERAVRLRGRNPNLVIQEMLEVRDRFRITFFKMNDAETNPSRMHFINLCKEMVEQKLDVPWGCNMRCDKVDEEMCQWAVKARCEEFWMGLESGSPEIHRDINKGTTVEMIKKAFAVAKKYGIKRRTYALLGTPLESFDTIKQTEKLIDEVDPEIIGFSILAPYPGTAYWKPELDELDWSQVDEFSNTTWRSNYLTNEDLRREQARLIEKYSDKLAPIIRKKQKLGIGGAQTLDSMMGAM
jgi:radical SAM superfamily enzyme YgiQ (UPF0313 family)/very-short-patch-repair endonuclease